jgi:hypothetical protein
VSTVAAPTRYVVAERARKIRLGAGIALLAVVMLYGVLLSGHGLAAPSQVAIVLLVSVFFAGQLVRLGAIIVDEWHLRDGRGLPAYGRWPRLACTVAAHVIASLWLLGIVVSIARAGWPGHHGGDPEGPFVAGLRMTGAAVFFACLVVAFFCLVPWLAAEVVAGYREPRGQRWKRRRTLSPTSRPG